MKSGGDNEPIDHDGNLTIQNATVFAGGTKGMEYLHSGISSTNQNYKYSTTSYTSGKSIYVKNASSSVEYHTTIPKSINYLFYTSPNTTSSYSFATSGSATCKTGNAWGHTWNSGEVTTTPTEDSDGVITYTCSVCNATERQAVKYYGDGDGTDEDDGDNDNDNEATAFKATFSCDDGIDSINVYYTQTAENADETNVAQAYARDGSTGEILVNGNGQINFTVIPKTGYTASVEVSSGSYKNLKDPSDTGIENMYRITKITSDLTVNVTTIKNSVNDSENTNSNTTNTSNNTTNSTNTSSNTNNTTNTNNNTTNSTNTSSNTNNTTNTNNNTTNSTNTNSNTTKITNTTDTTTSSTTLPNTGDNIRYYILIGIALMLGISIIVACKIRKYKEI